MTATATPRYNTLTVAPIVPVLVYVICPICRNLVDVSLVVDVSLLPLIPVRAAWARTSCDGASLRGWPYSDAEQAEIDASVNTIIARVGQHMLHTAVAAVNEVAA